MNSSHQEAEQVNETEFGGTQLHQQKKIIYFSSGETLELEDSEEEDEEEESSNKTPFKEHTERTKFSFKNVAILVGRISLLACDFLGERLAGALGLNAAKYQYAIDQHNREHKVVETSGDHLDRQVETVCLSPKSDGSHYGATRELSPPSTLHESREENHKQRNEGYLNKGFQSKEDSWE